MVIISSVVLFQGKSQGGSSTLLHLTVNTWSKYRWESANREELMFELFRNSGFIWRGGLVVTGLGLVPEQNLVGNVSVMEKTTTALKHTCRCTKQHLTGGYFRNYGLYGLGKCCICST